MSRHENAQPWEYPDGVRDESRRTVLKKSAQIVGLLVGAGVAGCAVSEIWKSLTDSGPGGISPKKIPPVDSSTDLGL